MDSFMSVIIVLKIFVIPAILGFFVYHFFNTRDKDPWPPYIISVVVVAGIFIAENMYSRGEPLFEGLRVLTLLGGIVTVGFAGIIIVPLSNYLKKSAKNKS